MSAETDFRAELIAHAPLLAMVGGAPNRIAFDKVPEGIARPFVVMVRESTEKFATLDGADNGARITFALQCWGDTRAQAEELADMVEAALRASTLEPNGIPTEERSSLAEPDLDLEGVNLTVDWWVD